jgi:hypothetical protein
VNKGLRQVVLIDMKDLIQDIPVGGHKNKQEAAVAETQELDVAKDPSPAGGTDHASKTRKAGKQTCSM